LILKSGMSATASLPVHPAGEEVFSFPTYGGQVRLSPTDDALTPFGGLVPWAAFQKQCGIFEQLAKSCPVTRTSPNAAPVYDVLVSFALTALCDGRRFVHVQRLREDPTLNELFGLQNVVGDDTIRRLFVNVDETVGAHWVAAAATGLWRALPEKLILDWDATVQTKYGQQEGAEVGYNPQKRGRRSFHPLLAVAAGTRLCPYYRFRAGNTVSASQWEEAMAECQQWLGPAKVWLNRGDLGFGQERILAWHEKQTNGPHYLFKLKLTANVRRALAAVPEEKWQGPASHGVLQVAEVNLQLPSWSRARRVILGRRSLGLIAKETAGTFWDESRHEFEAYATNLPEAEANAWQVVELYRRRADTENVFDELKNQWGFNGFCSRKKNVSALAARLGLLVYNLWHLFLRLLEPSRHVESAGGRRWFLLIAARLVKSGRQKELQVAVQGAWWEQLRAGYQRVSAWLRLTAAQLKTSLPTPIQLNLPP
jgi:hypothetical protein